MALPSTLPELPLQIIADCYDPALSLADMIQRAQQLCDASVHGVLSCVRQGLLDGIAMHAVLADLGYDARLCAQLQGAAQGDVVAALRRAQMVQGSMT